MTPATAMPAAARARGAADRGAGPRTLVVALALGAAVSVGVWILGTPPAASPNVDIVVIAAPPVAAVSSATKGSPVGQVATAMRVPRAPVPRPYNVLLDPGFSLGAAPATLAASAPLAAALVAPGPVQVATADTTADLAAPEPPADAEEAEAPFPPTLPVPSPVPPHLSADVPLPARRPSVFREPAAATPARPPSRQFAQAGRRSAAPVAPADNRSFFEKMFGGPPEPKGPALAYAAPETNLFDDARRLSAEPPPNDDRHTAVYDISAHTVYMPDGSRLEAHSGLGGMLDDPRSVHERNRGATPPHLYQLSLREQLFHGVQALRLNPVGGGGVYGRDGLLAHTFMLGPNGDSNGCVSFRNYNSFLEAFRNGQITRLSVVAGG